MHWLIEGSDDQGGTWVTYVPGYWRWDKSTFLTVGHRQYPLHVAIRKLGAVLQDHPRRLAMGWRLRNVKTGEIIPPGALGF